MAGLTQQLRLRGSRVIVCVWMADDNDDDFAHALGLFAFYALLMANLLIDETNDE